MIFKCKTQNHISLILIFILFYMQTYTYQGCMLYKNNWIFFLFCNHKYDIEKFKVRFILRTRLKNKRKSLFPHTTLDNKQKILIPTSEYKNQIKKNVNNKHTIKN